MLNENDIITHHPSYGSKRYGDLTELEKKAYNELMKGNVCENVKIGGFCGLSRNQ